MSRALAPRYNAPVGRLILFDVDNTLLYSGGAGGVAMRRAFHQLYGIDDGFRRIEFSGRSDWAILRDAMRQQGLLDGRSEDDFRREMVRFKDAYGRLLAPALREATSGRVMPGVPQLLAVLAGRENMRIGLATGNFRQGAFVKLRHFGLDTYFENGGFGDDAEDRGDLVAIAIQRMSEGAEVDPASVCVIGDTPLDIEAARANGVRALAVATGPLPVDALLAAGADVALEDLSDTEAVVSVLLR